MVSLGVQKTYTTSRPRKGVNPGKVFEVADVDKTGAEFIGIALAMHVDARATGRHKA